MEPQLKKGVLEFCILAQVEGREQYGYDIIRQMQRYFPEMGESAFYVILRRLHRSGALEQFLGEGSGGPPRKYYRITEQGRQQCRQQQLEWRQLIEIVAELTDAT